MTHKAIGEVRVKPLEWRDLTSPREDGPPEPTGDIEAYTMIGEYSVCFDDDMASVGSPWCCWSPHECVGHFAEFDAAKAAAQADYEARILAALDRSPTVVEEEGASVYTVYDWAWTDETGDEHYARTPERAVRLQAEGQKLTPVYTRAAAPPSPSKPEQAPSPVPQAVAWTDVSYLMSIIDAAIEDGFDPDEDGPLLDEIRDQVKSGASPLSGGDTGKVDRAAIIKECISAVLAVPQYKDRKNLVFRSDAVTALRTLEGKRT